MLYKNEKILITGGAGYIGSHIAVSLARHGYDILLLDDFSKGHKKAVKAVENIIGRNIKCFQTSILNLKEINEILAKEKPDAIIHLAGLKGIGESIEQPERYHKINVNGTDNIVSAMKTQNIKNIIFSSSASVYGSSNIAPYDETMDISMAANPYARSKIEGENILIGESQKGNIKSIILRYFNPIGAEETGRLGEFIDPGSSNIISHLIKVAKNQQEAFTIFGNDYKTEDGTCERDYIHIMDIADGHVAATEFLIKNNLSYEIFNLGCGNKISVLELVKKFEKTLQIKIPLSFGDRREGDLETAYAKVDKAEKILNWKYKRSIESALLSQWNFENLYN